MSEKKNELVYYVDGACSGNPGSGGFGIVRLAKIYSDRVQLALPYWYQELFPYTTNNRMELGAVIHVLQLANAMPQYHYVIYSDSAYVVNMCNDWIWNWAKNNWTRAKNKPIENIELVKKLYKLLTSDISYEIKKTAGHAGILENELADSLAANNMSKFHSLIQQNNIQVDF